MLRLRPSEITLTPEEVEDTLRRIAQRRASRATAAGMPHVPHRHGHPILRRAPQRAMQDAITAIDNIPVLVPQAQYAALVSTAEDGTEYEHGQLASQRRSDSFTGTALGPHVHGTASTAAAGPSTSQFLNLPLRPNPNQPNIAQQSFVHHQTTNAASIHPVRTDEHVAVQAGEETDPNMTAANPPDVRSANRPTGPADLRGGGKSDTQHTSSSSIDDIAYIRSPLRRVHKFSSPPQQTSPGDPVKTPTKTLNSKERNNSEFVAGGGINDDHVLTSSQFDNQDSPLRVPQTEPRKHRTPKLVHIRSLSSGNRPHCSDSLRQLQPANDLNVDNFGAVSTPELLAHRSFRKQHYVAPSAIIEGYPTGCVSTDKPEIRSRQFSSSETSAAFSYYGSLPSGSRQASSEDSDMCQLYPSRNADTSIGPATGQPLGEYDESQVSSVQLPDSLSHAVSRTPQNLSPLPSVSYNRDATQSTDAADTVRSGPVYTDAAFAAVQDLDSPLGDFADQYQYLTRDEPARPGALNQQSSVRYYVGTAQSARTQLDTTSRMQMVTENLQAARAMAARRDQLRTAHGFRGDAPSVATNRSATRDRGRRGAQSDQGSSENAPAATMTPSAQEIRESQVQAHRAAFERLNGAVQAMQAATGRASVTSPSRYNIAQPAPREETHLRRGQASTQLVPRDLSLRGGETPMTDSPRITDDDQDVSGQGQAGMPIQPQPVFRPPAYYDARQVTATTLQHTSTRTRRRRPPVAPSAMHMRSSRDSPLTALALDHGSGTISRRPGSPYRPMTVAARAYRRMPAQQIDQENSGNIEMLPAMREQDAINSRYNEDRQRHVMDETPPRLGRFERRMGNDG